MGRFRCLFLTAALLGCGAAPAGELLVTGRVESVLLLPKGAPACPVATGAAERPGASARTVAVANDCGCQQSRVRVEQTLLGERRDGVAVIDTRLGEWCRPQLPLDEQTILIDVNGDSLRWSPLTRRDGAWWFSPKALSSVAGVDWRTISVDGEGLAPLDRLLGQFAH